MSEDELTADPQACNRQPLSELLASGSRVGVVLSKRGRPADETSGGSVTDKPFTNGASRYQSEKVRVAIVGVGNCASSFVQGVEFYKDADVNERVPGLMHVDLGGYH